MTQRGRGWFERLAGDSLRSQYRLAVVVVLGSLVLTSVVSALSVVWANDVLQEQSDRATSLKGVNSSIRLDMADAETSLRMGDYFEGYVEEQARELGLTLDTLRAWAPPTAPRRTRGRRRAA